MTALEERNQARARKRTQRAKARNRGPRGDRRLKMDTIGVHDPRTGRSKHVEVQSRRPSPGPRSNSRRIYPHSWRYSRGKKEPRAASVTPVGRGGVYIVNA